MPTYREVMDTDLSVLTAAAAKWEAMADKFQALESAYRKKVQSISGDGTWLGYSASAAATNSARTRNEFVAAQKEARAIASILRDAHSQFTNLVGKVKAAVEEAEKAGMTVTSDGRAHFDFTKADKDTAFAARHDPDLPETEASWPRRIDSAVQAVNDLDYAVKLSLRKAANVDGFPWAFGFNGEAKGTIQETKPHRETGKQRTKGELDRLTPTIIRALSDAAVGFTKPGDWGTKLLSSAIEGLAGATGHNNTQGITFGVSGGLGVVGVGWEWTLVRTQKPDGGTQVNLLYSGATTTWGWDIGASANLGIVKSNADDFDQLKGPGWEKGGSIHAGAGLWAEHQNALGTTNSKGEDVTTVSGGFGFGVGNEISTGFSKTDGWKLWESEKREKE